MNNDIIQEFIFCPKSQYNAIKKAILSFNNPNIFMCISETTVYGE